MTVNARHSIFAAIHQSGTSPQVRGLRLAEVDEVTDKGYILKWLSGTIRSKSAPARAAIREPAV